MEWVRANTPAQREQRKEAIYRAALEIFSEDGYLETSLNAIAARAGIAKSNVYRYYHSKDEVFLDIFMELYDRWFADIGAKLDELPARPSPALFASVFAASFAGHDDLLSLTPHLFVSIEANSSRDQLFKFKCFTRDRFEAFRHASERIYPELNLDDIYNFLRLIHGPVSSFWAASQLNATLTEIYKHDDFAPLRSHFTKDLQMAIEVIIEGLLAKAARTHRS